MHHGYGSHIPSRHSSSRPMGLVSTCPTSVVPRCHTTHPVAPAQWHPPTRLVQPSSQRDRNLLKRRQASGCMQAWGRICAMRTQSKQHEALGLVCLVGYTTAKRFFISGGRPEKPWPACSASAGWLDEFESALAHQALCSLYLLHVKCFGLFEARLCVSHW